jgi:hypothetical protein
MPKKAHTFFHKVKIVYRWLTDNKYGLTTTCGYCESTAINLYEKGTTEDRNVGGIDVKYYKAKYICHNCGAIAVASETWYQIKELKQYNKKSE